MNRFSNWIRPKQHGVVGRCNWAVFTLAAFLQCPNSAGAAGKLYYGSREGMTVTVRSLEGLDTSRAIIRTAHTREDAENYCAQYSGLTPTSDGWDDCIKSELATRINDVVTANCHTGVFTNFYGDRLRYIGRNTRGVKISGAEPDYLVRDLGSGQLLGDYTATGYFTNLGIFAALCPKTAPHDLQ